MASRLRITPQQLGAALIGQSVPLIQPEPAQPMVWPPGTTSNRYMPPLAPPVLPPYEPPGTISNRYMPPLPPPETLTAPPPQPAPRPAPVPVAATPPHPLTPTTTASPQGNYGPAWNAYDPNTDPRYLPEQWAGRWNNPYWPT
jgi:hypothetical protein